jgi:diguanylate cyclase (GGDEF)-like protein/putative nucleotidyltransferase with HDIG domain
LAGLYVDKKDIGHLPLAARVYIAAMNVVALAILGYCGNHWQSIHLGQFLLYLGMGILCSNLKVCLPGITSTLSVNYLFILTSVAELTLPQTVVIACSSGVAQLFLSAHKRPRGVQIVFAFTAQTICSAATYYIYHSSWMPDAVPFRLFAASVIYFLSNSCTVGAIVSLTEGKPFLVLWRNNFFWTAPHYLVGGALAGLFHFWNDYAGWQTAVLVFPMAYLVYHSYRLYLGRLAEEKRHVAEVADLHLRTIQALALAIDARDGTTFGHLRRVQVYAREMGRELGISEDERRALDAAALLHDIGKLAVPEYIISKPGKLTPEEFEKMKVHPVVGAEILESVQFPYPVVPIVRAHHEKWNGKGYPFGLQGEEIPIGARIVAAVDCLDALASDRQYRRAMPLDEAMRHVVAESGTTFDPQVVDILQRRYTEFEELARKQTQGSCPLSTTVHIGSGGAPAAGFETSSAAPASPRPGFIASIASARQEFQTLLELTQELGNSLRVDETLALLASRLRSVIPYHGIAIYTIEEGRLVNRYASGDDAALFSSLAIPLGEGISGWVTQNNKPIVNGNPSVEPGYLNDPSKYSALRSALAVPLSGIGGVIGALTLYHRESGAFNKDHLRVLLAVSAKAGLTIENALRFVQAEETAVTDGLTGLPNTRSLFLTLETAVKEAAQNGSGLAVLVTDMDGFKKVNDRFGHAAGDRVLERAAELLSNSCRKGDYVARMGGDEFVLLLPGVQRETLQERIRQLNHLVRTLGRDSCGVDSLGLSVGVSFYPDDGHAGEELLAAADARMYEMKREHHSQSARVWNLAKLAEAVDTGLQTVEGEIRT